MERFTLDSYQSGKFNRNLLVFLIPLAIIYLGQIVVTLQTAGNIVELTDFIPTSITLGGIFYYILSTLIDYRKKLQESNDFPGMG